MTPPPFQLLLDRHADDVLRFLVASLGRADAEDAFQETFLAALRAWPRLRDGSNLKAWVLTIAHRKALDVHRARARRPVPVAGVDDRPAPEGRAADDELWSLVRELSPRQREVLALRYAADLPHGDVAAALGTTEQAARRAAADAVATLRRRMQP